MLHEERREGKAIRGNTGKNKEKLWSCKAGFMWLHGAAGAAKGQDLSSGEWEEQ